MTPLRVLLLSCACAIYMNAIAAEPPGATPSPSVSATPVESEALPTAVAESLTDPSAQRAAVERTKIYRTGADYRRWLESIYSRHGQQREAQRHTVRFSATFPGSVGGTLRTASQRRYSSTQ